MPRRSRHGRQLRAAAGAFPRSTVGSARVAPIAAAGAERLARLTGAGQPASAVPAFGVTVSELPSHDQIQHCRAVDVAAGALLASHRIGADETVTLTLFARPLLLWSGTAGESLTSLVRHVLAEQLAAAVGVDVADLDPDAL